VEASDLSLLATLDALLQEGSVTKAARRVGLSTPAMSHALARVRERLGDPVLVRSGRGMTLTPRAEELKPRVHAIVDEARLALEPQRPFVPAHAERTFVVHASDYVLTVMGLTIDRILRHDAPSIAVRFVPNTADDPARLRDGADLAIGIYGDLPPEMHSRQLLTDRFVCVVRRDHPEVGQRLSLAQFEALSHIQVAPRGRPGGYVDDALKRAGVVRRVARSVPYFLIALGLAAQTDYLLTVSERVARPLAPSLGLKVFPPPLVLKPYALSLVWHPRFDRDTGHRYLREVLTRAAREAAGDVHADALTRLTRAESAGRAGKRRRRPLR
jgi:DNA-binding transcriptional LysR family regulator